MFVNKFFWVETDDNDDFSTFLLMLSQVMYCNFHKPTSMLTKTVMDQETVIGCSLDIISCLYAVNMLGLSL